MSATHWQVTPAAAKIVERELDYTASFDACNVDSGNVVQISFTQGKGQPVADLINALRALAQTLLTAAGSEEKIPGTSSEKLN